jgi:hypothetical protein
MSIDTTPAPPVALRTWLRRRWGALIVAALITAGTVIGIVAVANGGTAVNGPSLTRLDAAKDLCASVSAHVTIGDNGMTMTVDRVAAEDNPGAHVEQLDCILAALDTPYAVISHMDSTRALDGMQADEWGGFHATWTYHPDDGINLIIEDALTR